MNDDGDTKDDVKVPEGEVGEKINKLFKDEEKDTSKFHPSRIINEILTSIRRHHSHCHGRRGLHRGQGSPEVLDWLFWVRILSAENKTALCWQVVEMAATLFAYYLCEVAVLAKRSALCKALSRAFAGQCLGFYGWIWLLHCHMWGMYHASFPFRYILYGNDKIRGERFTA